MGMFFIDWQKIPHFESRKKTKMSTRRANVMNLHMRLWSNVYFNGFNQIKVEKNIMLEYFVRYESFKGFAHRVLLLEQGLVRPRIQYLR